jgi:hypothetical protein
VMNGIRPPSGRFWHLLNQEGRSFVESLSRHHESN